MNNSNKVIHIGKRILPLKEVALVELYEPKPDAGIQSVKNFRARVVLVSRESLLIEDTQEGFAQEHGFRPLPLDQAALNPSTRFRVEVFEPADDFTPTKPYCSRIRWYDLDGNDQSKLMLTQPEDILEILGGGHPQAELPPARSAPSSSRPRRARRSPSSRGGASEPSQN